MTVSEWLKCCIWGGGNISNNRPVLHLQYYKNSLFWLAFTQEWGDVCWLRGGDGGAKFGLLLSGKWGHGCLEVCRVALGKFFHQQGRSVLGFCGGETKDEFRDDRENKEDRWLTQEENADVQGQTEGKQSTECQQVFFVFLITLHQISICSSKEFS